MLLNTMYNWIKYKTLPPSLLFKNRLFVERDSKHRRVMTNMGLSFRNSKWAGYNRKNVSLKLSENYSKLVKVLLFAIIIFYLFSSFLTGGSYSYLWFLLDNFISWTIFIYFLVTFAIQFLITRIYTIMTRVFWKLEYSTFNKVSNTNNENILTKTQTFDKSLQLPLLYQWIKKGNVPEDVLTTLFFKNNLLEDRRRTNNFLQNLFKLSYKINLTKKILQKNNLIFKKNQVKALIFKEEDNFLNKQHLPLLLGYLLKLRNSEKTRSNFYIKRFKWNLYNFSTTEDIKQGLFFQPKIKIGSLTYLLSNVPELPFINHSMVNQQDIFRRANWLYKYSNLNRSFLETSQKLTQVKTLLGDGFYNTTLKNRNLWAANELRQENQFYKINNLLYKNTLNNSNFLTLKPFSLNNKNSKNSLTFFETSYFWFLQRTNLFTNSKKNRLNSSYKKVLKLPEYKPFFKEDLNLTSLTSFFLRSAKVITNPLEGQLLLKKHNQIKLDSVYLNNNDFFLSYTEKSIFTEDTSNVLTQVLRNNTFTKKTFHHSPMQNQKQLFNSFNFNLKTLDKTPKNILKERKLSFRANELSLIQDLNFITYLLK